MVICRNRLALLVSKSTVVAASSTTCPRNTPKCPPNQSTHPGCKQSQSKIGSYVGLHGSNFHTEGTYTPHLLWFSIPHQLNKSPTMLGQIGPMGVQCGSNVFPKVVLTSLVLLRALLHLDRHIKMCFGTCFHFGLK